MFQYVHITRALVTYELTLLHESSL